MRFGDVFAKDLLGRFLREGNKWGNRLRFFLVGIDFNFSIAFQFPFCDFVSGNKMKTEKLDSSE